MVDSKPGSGLPSSNQILPGREGLWVCRGPVHPGYRYSIPEGALRSRGPAEGQP